MSRFSIHQSAEEYRVIDAQGEHRFPAMGRRQALLTAMELNDLWERFEDRVRRFNALVDAREAKELAT